MKQTTFCVPLEVKPDSCSPLSALIERMKAAEDTGAGGFPENFAQLQREVPSLHFMSMSVFPTPEFDPMFILEANIDGPPGVFWAQLEAALGDDLRDVLRCCKRPLDGDGPLYDAVTAPDARAPVAPYFEARTQPPSVFAISLAPTGLHSPSAKPRPTKWCAAGAADPPPLRLELVCTSNPASPRKVFAHGKRCAATRHPRTLA